MQVRYLPNIPFSSSVLDQDTEEVSTAFSLIFFLANLSVVIYLGSFAAIY
jgi:hypothetical protein